MDKGNLRKEIAFIEELEKLKLVYRQNRTLDPSRFENSAEHSWHIAVMGMVLEKYFPVKKIDMHRTLKMLLIHDIVEIQAGDHFLYNEGEAAGLYAAESEGAEKTFGLLPDVTGSELVGLWREFEARQTPESQFAVCMDALQPLINHLLTGQDGNNPHGLTRSRIIEKKKIIKEYMPELWEYTLEIIDRSVHKGLYSPD